MTLMFAGIGSDQLLGDCSEAETVGIEHDLFLHLHRLQN
jgi:hypothetical protein